jgi:molybdate transport system substrate-binding protein
MRNADARARFAAGEPVTIARIGFGVAVRAGAPKPDIGSADAFRHALLQARSITFLPESAAGAYVLKVFERLGIADAMKAKTIVQTSPAAIPQAVAKGDAELGVFLTNVMIAPGVEPAGPFPGDLQQDLVFVGAPARETAAADAANALLVFLKTSDAAAIFRQKGVTPAQLP